MKKQYIVSEYMRSDVTTVTPDMTFGEVVQKMIEKKTNGVVVVDQNQRVVGMISGIDLISYLVPDYLEEDRHLAAFESGDIFIKRIQQVANDPAEKFMTHIHIQMVSATDSLMEAATLLSEHHIRQLPVVDAERKLVGYLNRTDIKLAIGDVLKNQSES